MTNKSETSWLKRFIASIRSKVMRWRTAHLVTSMSIAECSQFLTITLNQQNRDDRYRLNGIISKQGSDRVEGNVYTYYAQDKEQINYHASARIEITAADLNQCDVHITTTLGSYYAVALIMAVILAIGNLLAIIRLSYGFDLVCLPLSFVADLDTAGWLALPFLLCLPTLGFLGVASAIALYIRGRRAQEFLMAFYVEGLQATVGT